MVSVASYVFFWRKNMNFELEVRAVIKMTNVALGSPYSSLVSPSGPNCA